jgi:hypothetical protein
LLAHERWAQTMPGWAGLCGSVAERLRGRPGFDDACSTFSRAQLEAELDVQRFIKAQQKHPQLEHDSAKQNSSGLACELHFTINFELHRRKTFWVDESLACWTEQRMRWIEPYWKGPDLAAVIEKTYKMTT